MVVNIISNSKSVKLCVFMYLPDFTIFQSSANTFVSCWSETEVVYNMHWAVIQQTIVRNNNQSGGVELWFNYVYNIG